MLDLGTRRMYREKGAHDKPFMKTESSLEGLKALSVGGLSSWNELGSRFPVITENEMYNHYKAEIIITNSYSSAQKRIPFQPSLLMMIRATGITTIQKRGTCRIIWKRVAIQDK